MGTLPIPLPESVFMEKWWWARGRVGVVKPHAHIAFMASGGSRFSELQSYEAGGGTVGTCWSLGKAERYSEGTAKRNTWWWGGSGEITHPRLFQWVHAGKSRSISRQQTQSDAHN